MRWKRVVTSGTGGKGGGCGLVWFRMKDEGWDYGCLNAQQRGSGSGFWLAGFVPGSGWECLGVRPRQRRREHVQSPVCPLLRPQMCREVPLAQNNGAKVQGTRYKVQGTSDRMDKDAKSEGLRSS